MINDYSIDAGEYKDFVGGYGFTILESNYRVDVQLFNALGAEIEVATDVGSSWFWRQPIWTEIPRVAFIRVTALTNGTVGRIQSSEGISGNNVLAGSVDVPNAIQTLDGSLEIVKDSRGFVVEVQCPSSAGEYSIAQLWNPPGSGVNLVVDEVNGFHTLPAVHPLYLYRSSTKLVTNFGAAAAVEGNKFLNSAVYSGAEFQYENTATILSGIEGSALLAKYRGQYEDSSYILKKPFVLSPGVGLNFSSTLVNGIVSASYQYHSEKV